MIQIHGCSDDLIEVTGDITEEFMFHGEETYVGLSDGTLLKITYDDDGDWKIKILKGSGQVVPAYSHNYNEAVDYSDVFDTARPISWVVCGSQIARS